MMPHEFLLKQTGLADRHAIGTNGGTLPCLVLWLIGNELVFHACGQYPD